MCCDNVTKNKKQSCLFDEFLYYFRLKVRKETKVVSTQSFM